MTPLDIVIRREDWDEMNALLAQYLDRIGQRAAAKCVRDGVTGYVAISKDAEPALAAEELEDAMKDERPAALFVNCVELL